MSLQILNCRLIMKGRQVLKNILINEGKIAKIDNQVHEAEKHIDARGKFVIPGVIDPHIHARDFQLSNKETIFSASKAAAAGGVTTFLDMPNTKPAVVTLELLKKRRELAKKSIVNYGFHFGGNFDAKGSAGNKLFMNVSTGKMIVEDKKETEKFFRNSRMLSVHAEEEKVKEAVMLAKKYNTRLYLCHISLKSEIDFLKEAIKKKKTKNIFIEVTPHHLFLTKIDEKRLGSLGMMKPPLRTKKDQEELWRAIKTGLIDTVGSDHAPHTKKEKKTKNPPFGVPGLETTLPLLLDAVNRRKIGLVDVVRLTSKNPAKIFRIKNKGIIKEGYDADLVVIDMKKEKKVDNKKLFTKCGWSPFHARKLKGWPVMTIIGGNIAYEHTGKIGKVYTKTRGKEAIFY
jgi:dihydroorotase